MKPLYKPELEHLVGKIKADLNSKQDKLTAGENVVIANNTILATDTVYDDTAVQAELGKKADKTYVDNKVKTDVPENAVFTDTPTDISGKQDKLTAGDNIIITNNTISATDTIYDDTSIQTELDKKADKTYVDNKVKTDVPENAVFTDTNTTYTEITTAEIDTGTSSTLRTITARRLKYLLDKIVALFPSKTSDLTNDSGFLTSVTKSDVGLGNVDNLSAASIRSGTTKADVGLSNVDNVKQMPISGGVLENYREKLTTVSASGGSINLSLGNVFQHTPSGNTTYTISNAVNGQAHSFTSIINMGSTVRTLTFPASVKWQGGEIPDMSTANKTYVLTFMTVDGGTTWFGMFGGEF